MPLACLYGRCLGGNVCQLYSSRGDSGQFQNKSQKVHANRAFILADHRIEFDWLSTPVSFWCKLFNSTRDGSSVPMVRDALSHPLGSIGP